jgi:hypothetical protein
MISNGPALEQDSTGRTEVPEVFQKAFITPDSKPSTGLTEGTIKVPTHEGLFSRARRALSKVAEKMDTNKENKPPLGKAF